MTVGIYLKIQKNLKGERNVIDKKKKNKMLIITETRC